MKNDRRKIEWAHREIDYGGSNPTEETKKKKKQRLEAEQNKSGKF